MKNAAECSAWNFGNKAALLQAEKMSLSSKNREAEAQYDAAIKASHESRFVHEEGLGKNKSAYRSMHFFDVTPATEQSCNLKHVN